MRARRAAFFAGKACARCGGVHQLELDHVERASKVHHAIWSWSQERREAELAKCQVLCRACHREKTRAENRRPQALTAEVVGEMRRQFVSGARVSELARSFGVSRNTVSRAVTGATWSWLLDPPPVSKVSRAAVSRAAVSAANDESETNNTKGRAA